MIGFIGINDQKGLNTLILSIIRGWDGPVRKLFNKLENTILPSRSSKALTLQNTCGPWINSQLHRNMEATVRKFIGQLTAQEMEKALKTARRESFTPIINDQAHFDRLREDEHKHLQQSTLFKCGIRKFLDKGRC